MFTFESIKNDLVQLGVRKGDMLFLRVSYRSIGKIEGGPKVFLDALRDIIGSEGTIVLTAFPPKHISQLRFFYRHYICSKDNFPKPFTGIIPIMALTYPEARLSEKLEFPFVVIGQYADYLTKNHTHEKSGYWLLREIIDKFDSKCLRVGGKPLFGSTHVAIEDIFKENGAYMSKLRNGLYIEENGTIKWYDEPNITFCGKAFSKFTDRITRYSIINEGKVGDGYAIITSMRKSYQEELSIFREDIHNLLCDDLDCITCRTSYSFSDSSNFRFLLRQLRLVFSSDCKNAITRLRDVFLKILFEKKTV